MSCPCAKCERSRGLERELADAKAALGNEKSLRAESERIMCETANNWQAERAESARLRETVALQDAVLQASEKRHQATQRAWALWLLENGYGIGAKFTATRKVLDELPAPVAALVREMAPYPIDTCDECKQRAPVKAADYDANKCAWPGGCARKEEERG